MSIIEYYHPTFRRGGRAVGRAGGGSAPAYNRIIVMKSIPDHTQIFGRNYMNFIINIRQPPNRLYKQQ